MAVRCRSIPCNPTEAPNSDTILFVTQMRRPSGVGPPSTSGFTVGSTLLATPGVGSTSTRPSCMFHGDAAARCHSCVVAHDVLPSARVGPVPANVPPLHSEFLPGSRDLVRFEGFVLTERSHLLLEWFASDTPACRRTVPSDTEYRQCPS